MNNRWIYYNEQNGILYMKHLLRKDTPHVNGLERACREMRNNKRNLIFPELQQPSQPGGAQQAAGSQPTHQPSQQPTQQPSQHPTKQPTQQPTQQPTHRPTYTTPCGKCSAIFPDDSAYKFCPECGTAVPNVPMSSKSSLPNGWKVNTDPVTKRNYYVGPSGVSQWAAPANVERRLAKATLTPLKTPAHSEEALCHRRLMIRDMKRPKSHVVVLEALLVEINRLRRD